MRIGISACFFHPDPTRPVFKGKTLLYLEESLVHWVMSHGALAYMLPSSGTCVDAQALISGVDGFVLQGGADVSPLSYGETPLKPEWSGDFVRDTYEIALYQAALAQNKPVLGICRGMQLMNVAQGGTLYQDITTQHEGAFVHRNWDVYDQNKHGLNIVEGSALQTMYEGLTYACVNSVHHQGVKTLGRDLVVQAYAEPDSVIECVVLNSTASYVMGVQWHPEFQKDNDGLLSTAPILHHFLTAVASRLAM